MTVTAIPTRSTADGKRAIAGALLAVAALVVLGFLHLALPTPVAADAQPQAFAAGRAARSVERIARAPHPTGTAENAQVRAELVAALTALGLETEVQSGFSVASGARAAGMVHNIVGRLPGSRPGKALLLMAHYDSVPHSPGAADDGAAVAAILETLRAIRQGPALHNDILCVLTDGEETGLLGARLFHQQHRFARQVGMVLNADFRGNSGPLWMFQTGPANGKVIDAFAGTVARPLGNSLLNDLYKLMPNDTDFTVFQQAGVAGLNFAAGERYTSYHTELDRADLLDRGTLQHTGDVLLALTRHFGNADLSALSAPDRIYADVPLAGLVSYSQGALWPLLAVAVLLTLAALVIGARNGQLRIGRTLAAMPVFVVVAALAAGLCQLLWQLALLVHPGYRLMLHGSTYNAQWYLLFFAAVSIIIFATAQRLLARFFSAPELGMGAACVWLAGLAAASLLLPGATFFLTWPLLPLLAALCLLFSARCKGTSAPAQLALLVAGAAPALLLLPALVELIYNALTPSLVAGPMLVLALLLGLLWPLLARLYAWRALRLALALLAVLYLAGAAASAGFSAERPRPANLAYVQPQDGAPALWASTDAQLDAWTGPLFAGQRAPRNESAVFGQDAAPRWLAPAPALAVPVPQIDINDNRVQDGHRLLVLTVRSVRRAARIDVALDGPKVLRASILGQPYVRRGARQWKVDVFGMQDQPLRIELELAPGAAARVWARDFSYGLGPTGLAPHPADLLIQPFGNSGTMQAVASKLVPEPGQ